MKITKDLLKEMIKEEIAALSEAPDREKQIERHKESVRDVLKAIQPLAYEYDRYMDLINAKKPFVTDGTPAGELGLYSIIHDYYLDLMGALRDFVGLPDGDQGKAIVVEPGYLKEHLEE